MDYFFFQTLIYVFQLFPTPFTKVQRLAQIYRSFWLKCEFLNDNVINTCLAMNESSEGIKGHHRVEWDLNLRPILENVKKKCIAANEIF